MSRKYVKDKYIMLQYLVIFLIYFIIQFRFLNDTWFITDELDIMLGGKAIANGYQLYGDFLSQHMPISYYISAVFEMFGATTVTLQRIGFYIFYSFMWTMIYARYQCVVSKKALFIYPICFSCLIVYYDRGTVILSEHLAGIGFVILFLEFSKFYEDGKLKIDSYIMISLAILLTFGTIFVGIFGIFIIMIGVCVREVQWAASDKMRLGICFKRWRKKYFPLMCWVILPWGILTISYILKNNFGNFLCSAYKINTDIYSKYQGGYGESIIKALLGLPIQIMGMIQGLFDVNNFGFNTIIMLIVIVLVIAYLVKMAQNKGITFSCISALFLCAISPRGCWNFHGTQWIEVVSLLISIFIVDELVISKKIFFAKKLAYRTTVVILIILISSSYVQNFAGIADNHLSENKSIESDILKQITEKGEAVWQLDLQNDIPMLADRPSIQNVGAVPWMWEALGDDALGRFGNNPPRVAIYAEHVEVWGYKLKEYAPELVEYMREHYIQYENTQIHIRKDYYQTAYAKLNN